MHTPLYAQHQALNAQFSDFFGWSMPIHYGSILNEHQAVRTTAGVFDVSHMGIIDLEGADALSVLKILMSNDCTKLKQDGQCLYTCMLNHEGGIIDDLIVTRIHDQKYRLVVNASRIKPDFDWIQKHAQAYTVSISQLKNRAILAVQGPAARTLCTPVFLDALKQPILELKRFNALLEDNTVIARTGYTGEDGLEIICPAEQAVSLWKQLIDVGVIPCGLGARDTLRLEAGLNLYGQDMTDTTSPLESNIAWTVDWQDDARAFIGREALMRQKTQGVSQKLIGLMTDEAGVLRANLPVFQNDQCIGIITSGTYSPTLKKPIAIARIQASISGDCTVTVRHRALTTHVVALPFLKK
jgi:aminomethyltransferase